jgi:hypothetical protein
MSRRNIAAGEATKSQVPGPGKKVTLQDPKQQQQKPKDSCC